MSKVFVMDADGTRFMGIARALRKLGIKEAKAILENINPSPLQVLGVGVKDETRISNFLMGCMETLRLLVLVSQLHLLPQMSEAVCCRLLLLSMILNHLMKLLSISHMPHVNCKKLWNSGT